MISIIGRYIAKTTILATIVVGLVITCVLFLMALLGEMKSIGEGDYNFLQAIGYIFLRLPNEIYKFSPMLLLLGSIVGLSLLSSHRELAVARASGFSTARIVWSVLFAAFVLIVVTSGIGEWAGPNLSYHAEVRKENAKNAGQSLVTARGVWFHVDNNFIHIQHVIGRQLLEGVTRYEFDDRRHLQVAYYAKKLMYQDHAWVMNDVVETRFYDERTKSQSFATLPWNLKINPNLLNVGLVEPGEMSLPKLSKFSHYLKQNGLQASEYEYEFWQRIFQPFISLIMIFLAIPFVLSTMSASTLGWRIVVGVMVGFVFFISNAFLGQLCMVYQFPAQLAAALPLGVFLIVGVLLFNRMVRR